jgi:uncharacterized membrane protein YfcA
VTISATFISQLGLSTFTIVTGGLLVGGVAAAPFGAIVAKRLPTKTLMLLVGIVLTLTSLYGVVSALLR